MNNILVVNLKRHGDILSMGHLITSIKAEYPQSNISLVIYSDFETSASILKNVKNIYTIKRDKILTLKKNEIFSDAYSLEEFYSSVKEIKKISWDSVLNYSNDKVATHLTSFFCKTDKHFLGLKFDKYNNVNYSNNWSRVLNDVLPCYKFTPLTFNECYHKILGLKQKKMGDKIITQSGHNKNAFENITKLRKNESKLGNEIKVIGIQLKSSTQAKDIPFDLLVQLIDMILNNPEYYPLLFIAPTKEEREYANKLNKYFNNSLVTVEADLYALPSVLLNSDLLVTPDTLLKHMADLLEVPVVEVSMGWAPFLKQGSINSQSVILSDLISQRSFSSKSFKDDHEIKSNIKATDIYNAVRCSFNPKFDEKLKFTNGVSLYRVKELQNGVLHVITSGSVDETFEISRMMSRYALFSLLDGKGNPFLLDLITDLYKDSIKDWLKIEKTQLTNLTKGLLTTLRHLVNIPRNPKSAKDFALSLDSLFEYCKKDNLVSLAVLIFRSKIENLPKTSLNENIKDVEKLLYELKNNIQIIFESIRELENRFTEQKKHDLYKNTEKGLSL